MQNSPKWLIDENLSRLEHNRLVALINSLEEGFLAVDAQGRIEMSNGHALALLDSHKLNGRNLSEALRLFESSGAAVGLLESIEAYGGRLSTDELSVLHHDGAKVRLNLRASPVRAYGKRSSGGYVILLKEI